MNMDFLWREGTNYNKNRGAQSHSSLQRRISYSSVSFFFSMVLSDFSQPPSAGAAPVANSRENVHTQVMWRIN